MNKILALAVFLLLIWKVGNSQTDITWNMGMNISANTFGNMHPRMALDGMGNPMVVWGRMSDAAVMFSRWNGTNFTMPVKLNPTWLSVASASWMGPDIASHGDTVYVVAKRSPEVADTNRIFIFTSFNGGNTFNAPVELAFIADSISRFPTVTTNEFGNPIVAFMKFNSTFMDSRWVVSKSSDYGTTFFTDVKASGWGGSAEVCDCCPGALLSQGASSVMLYRDNNNNIRDIWAGISTNYAADFSSGMAVDNNNWMMMSCPSSGPDGVIIGDTLYSTFMSAGSGNFRNYLSKSSLSGGALSAVVNLTGVVPGLSQQNYPRIASDGNALAIVWKQTVNGAAQLPVLFTNEISNGLPPAYDTVDLDDITNCDVALSNGKIHVIWQDDNSQTVKYQSGLYPLFPIGLPEFSEEQISIFPNPASNVLNISTPYLRKIDNYKITDYIGREIMKGHQLHGNNIDISLLQPGLYYLNFNEGSENQVSKFVKL